MIGLTTSEAAARLGVTPATVRGYVHRGLLRPIGEPSGWREQSRFEPADLDGLPGRLRRPPTGLLGTVEVARRLGVDRSTVRRRVLAGRLLTARPGRCLVFSPGTVGRVAIPKRADPEPPATIPAIPPGRLAVDPLLRLVGKGRLRDVGVNLTRAKRYGVGPATADRWATACGFHPANVWGDEWFTVASMP